MSIAMSCNRGPWPGRVIHLAKITSWQHHKITQMHKAMDVFCNYLLVGFDDENQKLRQSTKLLKATVVDIFTKVELRNLPTLTSLDQLPSREGVKNELMSKLAAKSSQDDGLVCLVENEFEHQSEDLILSTIAAFGHTDHMLNVLVENRMLRTENSVLRQVQEMIGTVEISHPGFNTKAFLKDGWLDNNKEGVLVWRIDVTTNAIPLSITIDNIKRLKVLVSGIYMSSMQTVNNLFISPSWNGIDVDGFLMRWDNGVKVNGRVYSTDSDSFLNSVVDLPLSFIQNTLVALGLRD